MSLMFYQISMNSAEVPARDRLSPSRWLVIIMNAARCSLFSVHFFFCALIFGCVFQFNLLFSNQFLSSLIEPTIDWVRNPREIGKAEKLSPSPTYPKSGSKRTTMILKAVRRTDENAIRQHARGSAAMRTNENIETDRETIETDEKWQTVSSQRSNKIQKTICMHQRQPWVSLDRRSRKIRKLAEFIHTSLSGTTTHELNQPFRNMALRNRLQMDHWHISKEEERERI